jgi:hypothetical protein
MVNGFCLAFFNLSFYRLAGDNPYAASVFTASGSAPWPIMMALDVAQRKEGLLHFAKQVFFQPAAAIGRTKLLAGLGCEVVRELMYNLGCLNPPEVEGLSPLQQLVMRCTGYFVIGGITGIPNLAANWFYLSAIGAAKRLPQARHVALGCFWRGVAMQGIFGTKDVVSHLLQDPPPVRCAAD